MVEQPIDPKSSNPVKAHCPTCNAERWCDVHGHVHKPWSEEDRQGCLLMHGGVDHSLLECRGCETVFYLHDSWDSENMNHYYGPEGETLIALDRNRHTYPLPDSQVRPRWMDALGKKDLLLQNIMHEVYVAYDSQAYILATVGLRTALDRATEVLEVDPAITFDEKLTELQNGGWVGKTEHAILNLIANAGGAAAHRGWSPDRDDAEKLLNAIEAFLHRAFIVGQDTLSISANIPPKPKRKSRKTPA